MYIILRKTKIFHAVFPKFLRPFPQRTFFPTEQSLVDTILGKYCSDQRFTSAPRGGPLKPSLSVALMLIVVGNLCKPLCPERS